MRNEARSGKSQGRGVQRSNRGFFPNSLKAISSYLRSATSVASNLRSSASSVAHSDNHAASSDLVQWAGFDKLELGENVVRRVLHLGYSNGFQVWDVEEADNIRELVSKQDGLVSFLQMQPCPYTNESAADGFSAHRPLLIVVPGEENYPGGTVQGSCAVGYGGPSHSGSNSALCSVVQFYSLKSHSYVNTWRFRSAVCTVRCSPRIVAVALVAQIHCFDAATLQSKFSVLTYPVPQGMQSAGSSNVGYGPLALGPRWMAYAANHAVVPNTGRGSPQLTPSPGVSPSTSPANGNLVAHYAKESSKQIAASLMTLGDMGYKTITKYCSELRPDGSNSPRAESQSWRSSCNSLPGQTCETEFAGTVVVRDFVGKITIAQFRAHTSPLSALCFDPSGTLLVTASIHGHSLNVFRIMPSSKGNSTFDNGFTHVHLYKLHRGLRDAIIQDISFSDDSHWIVISSARGTNHLFAISPFGGPIGRHTHEETLTNFSRVASLVPSPKLCWWLGSRSFRANHSSLQPCSMSSPITLSVISRIKDRNAGWRGTVSDAAAAAAGRSISSSGAVTAVFHGGKSNAALSEKQNLICKKQIWIFYPSGYLIQYSLRLDNGAEGAYLNNTNSQISGACSEPSDQDLKVVVETIQKWDVFQVPNRVDREEDITSLFKLETSCSRAGRQEFGCGRNGVISPAGKDDAGNNGTVYEEKHHWHLSNAEVQMHQSKTPIWAKAEIFFHVMMPDHSIQDSVGGEVEIERIPSRVIEVKTHDLIPVFNNRSKSTNFQTNRSELISNGAPQQERLIEPSRTDFLLRGRNLN